MAVKVLKLKLSLMLLYLTDLGGSNQGSGKSNFVSGEKDIRRFYTTMPEELIWTTNGTLIDECVKCKFDNVTKTTNDYVLFTRNYSLDDVQVIMSLKGKFEIVRHRKAPSRMDVAVLKEYYELDGNNYTAEIEKMSHMEVLLYEDVKNKCGVFLNKFRKYTKKTEYGDYSYTDDDQSCEIRVKSSKAPQEPSKTCWEEFEHMCKVKPYFKVYQDSCWKP